MPNISISKDDYELLAEAANRALENGDKIAADKLDKLARKTGSALTKYESRRYRSIGGRWSSQRASWQDQPTTLVNVPNAKSNRLAGEKI